MSASINSMTVNSSASCLLTLEKVAGPIAKIGTIEKSFEVFEFFIWADRLVAPGQMGLNQQRNKVQVSNFEVIIASPSNVPTLAQGCFNGENLGNVNLYLLTNAAQENQILLQITLDNARITKIAMDIPYDIDKNALPQGVDKILEGDAVLDNNLPKLVEMAENYTPVPNRVTATKLLFAYDKITMIYASFEDDASAVGKTAMSIDLTTNVASAAS